MAKVGRPEMAKGTAATTVLAVKFSDLDVALLDALVARARAVALKSGAVGREASRGLVLRDLVRSSARALGLDGSSAPVAMVETEEVHHG